MISLRSACGAVVMAVAMLATTVPAVAQHRSMTQTKAGPFAIDYITEGGKFDRCAATLSPGPNMLRIAYTRNLIYSISVPGVPVPARTMDFHLNGEVFTVTPQTDAKRVRAWATVDTTLVGALMNVRNTIDIDLGAKSYSWPIGRTNLEDVFVALENCTHTAMGR